MIKRSRSSKDEVCCCCKRVMPDNVNVLRNTLTNLILCALCILDIAEVN